MVRYFLLVLTIKKNKKKDISLSINKQKNLLTHKGWEYPNNNFDFNYCFGGVNDLDIKVTPGIYNVGSIHTYVLDNSFISSNDFDLFNISSMDSDFIIGDIDVTNDGYFVLKIPFDKGFKIEVDGAIIDYSKVDDTFIGFYLNSGHHDIEIRYVPPFLNLGKCLSILGVGLFIVRRRFK